jgi:DNA-binding transcriptional LysR family regulator
MDDPGGGLDRLNAMLVFARVVEARSFAEAARRLALSKSQVSKLVAALEARLGAQLLQRSTRRLSLTEAGRGFYERCAEIVRAVEEAERAANHAQAAPRGLLRVNAPMSFGHLALAPLLPEFLSRHPQLRVELALDDRRVDGIEGAFDVTLRIARRLADSSLIARRIAPARVVVCGAPGYLARRGVPQTPEQLASHACLVYAYRERWQFGGPGGERSIDVAGPLVANNGDALREAACAGGGLVQLPRFLVAAELASGALRVVLECFEDPSASIWVLYSPTPHLSGKVRAFVDFLAERLGPQGRRASADPREHERARQRGERDGEEPGRSDPGERAARDAAADQAEPGDAPRGDVRGRDGEPEL